MTNEVVRTKIHPIHGEVDRSSPSTDQVVDPEVNWANGLVEQWPKA
jgi:hypothetical protein